MDVQVIEHNTEKDKTETVVSNEKKTCQPPIKIKPVTLAELFHSNDEGSGVRRYITRRTRMFDAIEAELKADCKKWGVVYIEPTSKDELPNKTKSRRQCLRRKMKTLFSKVQVDVIEEQLKTDCE